jgi:hypothetical protein
MKLDLATDRNVKKILLLASCLISAKCPPVFFDHNLPTNEKHNVAIPFSQAEYVFGVAY